MKLSVALVLPCLMLMLWTFGCGGTPQPEPVPTPNVQATVQAVLAPPKMGGVFILNSGLSSAPKAPAVPRPASAVGPMPSPTPSVNAFGTKISAARSESNLNAVDSLLFSVSLAPGIAEAKFDIDDVEIIYSDSNQKHSSKARFYQVSGIIKSIICRDCGTDTLHQNEKRFINVILNVNYEGNSKPLGPDTAFTLQMITKNGDSYIVSGVTPSKLGKMMWLRKN